MSNDRNLQRYAFRYSRGNRPYTFSIARGLSLNRVAILYLEVESVVSADLETRTAQQRFVLRPELSPLISQAHLTSNFFAVAFELRMMRRYASDDAAESLLALDLMAFAASKLETV